MYPIGAAMQIQQADCVSVFSATSTSYISTYIFHWSGKIGSEKNNCCGVSFQWRMPNQHISHRGKFCRRGNLCRGSGTFTRIVEGEGAMRVQGTWTAAPMHLSHEPPTQSDTEPIQHEPKVAKTEKQPYKDPDTANRRTAQMERGAIPEDCKPFDSSSLTGKALDIVRHYKIDQKCWLGVKGKTTLTPYFLVSGKAPAGPYPEENCQTFDPKRLVLKIGTGSPRDRNEPCWWLMDGDKRIYECAWGDDAKTKAEWLLKAINKYGFTHYCSRVRGSSITYWRR